MLALLVLAGCKTQPNEAASFPEYVISPKDAVPPDGLDRIRKGMSQEEVLTILGALYPVIHAADAEPSLPIADFFPYREGGFTKYIEISYRDDGRVDWIRYGFEKTYVLQQMND